MRQRETEGERDRQTDRQTHRQTERKIKTQRYLIEESVRGQDEITPKIG